MRPNIEQTSFVHGSFLAPSMKYCRTAIKTSTLGGLCLLSKLGSQCDILLAPGISFFPPQNSVMNAVWVELV